MIYIFIRISRLLEPLFSTFRAILGDGAKKQPNRFTAPELIIMNFENKFYTIIRIPGGFSRKILFWALRGMKKETNTIAVGPYR